VHGGISPSLNKIEDLNELDRFQELPKSGLLCDLVWSDPVENFDQQDEKGQQKGAKTKQKPEFIYNSNRGCSYNFTFKAVQAFLNRNNLLCLIRAHQVQKEGVRLERPLNDSSHFPCMISLFSAPNYCDVYDNKAALLHYNGQQLDIKLFTAAQHPFVLPNFQNAFVWSLPFLVEKLNEILVFFLNQISDEESEQEQRPESKEKENILDKINLIRRCYENSKRSSELKNSDLKLGSLTPTSRLRRRSSEIDRELLIDLEKRGVSSFEDANNLDSLQYKIINSSDEQAAV
jgi:serine/threonine-protein phosphatase 2B catalytic subunit